MTQRKFGWTDVSVPLIGMGTWMVEAYGRQEAILALKKGIELGLTHIDTAEMYGNGRAEEIISEVILERRNEIFLVSKVLPSNASYDGTIQACKKSLGRLGTKYLDLYLLHWPSHYPITETMRAMEWLVDAGLTRFIGVSNFDLKELQEAENALAKHKIACNQVMYHLKGRGIEQQLLPYCVKKNIAVVGYSPFGHGSFPSPSSHGGKVLHEMSVRIGRSPRQIALNFLTRPPYPLFTIPKSSKSEHVEENSGGMGWTLSKDDVVALDNAFPVPKSRSGLEMI